MPDRDYFERHQALMKGEKPKDPGAVALGRRGGRAYAERTSEADREARAKRGAEARWGRGGASESQEKSDEARERQILKEAKRTQTTKVEKAVDTLFEKLGDSVQRCALILHHGDAWTADPDNREFLVFSKRFPRSVVGIYERGVTRAQVMEDVEEVIRENRR